MEKMRRESCIWWKKLWKGSWEAWWWGLKAYSTKVLFPPFSFPSTFIRRRRGVLHVSSSSWKVWLVHDDCVMMILSVVLEYISWSHDISCLYDSDTRSETNFLWGNIRSQILNPCCCNNNVLLGNASSESKGSSGGKEENGYQILQSVWLLSSSLIIMTMIFLSGKRMIMHLTTTTISVYNTQMEKAGSLSSPFRLSHASSSSESSPLQIRIA